MQLNSATLTRSNLNKGYRTAAIIEIGSYYKPQYGEQDAIVSTLDKVLGVVRNPIDGIYRTTITDIIIDPATDKKLIHGRILLEALVDDNS